MLNESKYERKGLLFSPDYDLKLRTQTHTDTIYIYTHTYIEEKTEKLKSRPNLGSLVSLPGITRE